MSIIFNQIQYLTIFCILDLLESIYKKVKKNDYPSAGFAGRRVVGFGDLSIDIFLEVHNQNYSAHGVHFRSKINNLNENLAWVKKHVLESRQELLQNV